MLFTTANEQEFVVGKSEKFEISDVQVCKYVIKDSRVGDPVHLYIDDMVGRAGRLTVVVYGKSWSFFWASMFTDSVKQFLSRMMPEQLAHNLGHGSDYTVYDADAISKAVIKECDLSEDDLETFEFLDDSDITEHWIVENAELLNSVYGDVWGGTLPTHLSADYHYLLRIATVIVETFAE